MVIGFRLIHHVDQSRSHPLQTGTLPIQEATHLLCRMVPVFLVPVVTLIQMSPICLLPHQNPSLEGNAGDLHTNDIINNS